MKLDEAVAELGGKELDGVLSHWDFDRQSWPAAEEDRRGLLLRHMRDRRQVQERLDTMPSRLRELLIHVVRTDCCARPFDIRRLDDADLPLESFEILPVGMALAERGFLVMSRPRGGTSRTPNFQMAAEFSSLLETVLSGTRKPIEAILSLGSWLRFVGRAEFGPLLDALGMEELRDASQGDLREKLIGEDTVDLRRDRLESGELNEIISSIIEHGGVLCFEARRRLGIDASQDELSSWGRQLGSTMLGGFETAELTNLGLGQSTAVGKRIN